jgi:hypothetical protein
VSANLGPTRDEEVDRNKSTDYYAINIQYVLGFISSGDGGCEAARVLGLLGLPNDTTMETRLFPIIEERVSVKLKKLTDEIFLENLMEEVKLTWEASPYHDDDNDFDLWKRALRGETVAPLHH